MHLSELLENPIFSKGSVPEWMIGCFKRKSITFANGKTDRDTIVYWLQSRNLTVDLRLPVESEQVKAKDLKACSLTDLHTMLDYEGWSAESVWQNDQLSWQGGASFQLHNRWPAPAELKRVGDCMIEFAPSGAYVEDWRLQSVETGPLVGLRLIEEAELNSGRICHRDGALIINGNWVGLVLGRPHPLALDEGSELSSNLLSDDLVGSIDGGLSKSSVSELIFQFETSVGYGNLADGYQVLSSTRSERVRKQVLDLDGFEFNAKGTELTQHFTRNGLSYRRRFEIDSLEGRFDYRASTPQNSDADTWFQKEEKTLARYLS